MNKILPPPIMVVHFTIATIIGGLLAALIVRQFPAYKTWVDNVLLP